MKIRTLCIVLILSSIAASGSFQESNTGSTPSSTPLICSKCVHAHMAFLASDALRGRGSGTPDELVAATYIASQLEQYGLQPAEDNGSFLQKATLLHRRVSAPPRLTFKVANGAQVRWTNGKEILVLLLPASDISGPLQKVDVSAKNPPVVKKGAIIFVTHSGEGAVDQLAYELAPQGAAAVIIPESPRLRKRWTARASELKYFPTVVKSGPDTTMGPTAAFLAVSREAETRLSQVRNGTLLRLHASSGPEEETYTWNAVAKIEGSDSSQAHHDILLTAHLDHLGIGSPVHGDRIYNGADDDASGTTVVLELARALASGTRPRRTVIFALFGSEEKGGLGSNYFRAHPPVPLKDIAAYLEFEMIGRPDPTVARDTLWLTGWERTDLGPELAKHGAHLVGDPHPAEGFFQRSDNYVFAKQGVVAQTVSSYGLHRDYHQPSDDLAHIDFQHMDEAIGSMLEPVIWLANSDFVPQWKDGGKP